MHLITSSPHINTSTAVMAYYWSRLIPIASFSWRRGGLNIECRERERKELNNNNNNINKKTKTVIIITIFT
jgi:hypothetical protein